MILSTFWADKFCPKRFSAILKWAKKHLECFLVDFERRWALRVFLTILNDILMILSDILMTLSIFKWRGDEINCFWVGEGVPGQWKNNKKTWGKSEIEDFADPGFFLTARGPNNTRFSASSWMTALEQEHEDQEQRIERLGQHLFRIPI